jgi:hypothetical protein
MGIGRKVAGWVTSLTLFALVVAATLAAEVAPELLGDVVPGWVWWTILGGFAVFLGWALFNPKSRRHWRQQREAARERKRKLANFELD